MDYLAHLQDIYPPLPKAHPTWCLWSHFQTYSNGNRIGLIVGQSPKYEWSRFNLHQGKLDPYKSYIMYYVCIIWFYSSTTGKSYIYNSKLGGILEVHILVFPNFKHTMTNVLIQSNLEWIPLNEPKKIENDKWKMKMKLR